jgi:hypothetical protein
LESLIPELLALPNLRLVVTARQFEPSPATYLGRYLDHRLLPVKDTAAYRHYCQAHNVNWPDNVIQAFAQTSGYLPGIFAELFDKYLNQGGSRAR